jgi:hypothetical protein
MLHSNFCLEPAGDTPTRSHLYTAMLCGCIPVIFDHEPDTDQHPESFYRPHADGRTGGGAGASAAGANADGAGADRALLSAAQATAGWAFRHTPLPFRLNYSEFAVVYNAADVISGKARPLPLYPSLSCSLSLSTFRSFAQTLSSA